jgi:hypothetical protein
MRPLCNVAWTICFPLNSRADKKQVSAAVKQARITQFAANPEKTLARKKYRDGKTYSHPVKP